MNCDNPKHTHRCWPSRLGWLVVSVLAAYLTFLHSSHFADDESRLQAWHTAWERQWWEEREAFRIELNARYFAPPPAEHTRYGKRWRKP